MGMMNHAFVSFLIILFSLLAQSSAELEAAESSNVVNEIKVGVILDMESLVGKIIHSCVSIAISDFYALNSRCKTRIILHARDSKGDPLHALSAALDLLENVKVQAIVGPETLPEAKSMALLGDKAKVPMISLSSSPYSTHPYFFQATQDETTQFHGITAILDSFKWRNIILVYEDTDYGREIIPCLANLFQDMNTQIVYMSSISPSSADDQIIEELHKLMTMQTTVYVVHVKPSLATRFFSEAKRVGMMSEGYAWIITERTMSLLHSMDSSSVLRSMQGALGIKPYIPVSRKLHNFTLRWRKQFHVENPHIKRAKLNVLGILANDVIWALARAVERVGTETTQSGSVLLREILQSRFKGLGGKFQVMNRRLVSEAFKIVNVVGTGERTVGFWTSTDGITKGIHPSVKGLYKSAKNGLEGIIWPGGSTTAPKGWLLQMNNKRLRIGVPEESGFSELIKVEHDPQTNATTATGFCVDVFNAVIKVLPFQVPYDFFPLKGWIYDDLIYQVYLQNIDGVVGDITITANRSLYVDFTSPYTDLGVGMVARTDNKKNMWVFLEPLEPGLWLTSAGFFTLMGFVVWLIEHPDNVAFQGPFAQQIGTALWFSFANREQLRSNLSRFVVIIWVFVVLILTSSYTAILSSLLTVKQIEVGSKGSKVGYQRGSLLKGSNLNFSDLAFRTPKEFADALSRGNKKGGIAAVVDEIPYIKIFLNKYSDDLHSMIASESRTSNGFGYAFRKGSPLVPEISRAILKLREEGELERLEKAWFTTTESSSSSVSAPLSIPQKSENNTSTVLGLDSFRGLFLISGISSALALVLYYFHFLCERWNDRVYIYGNLVQQLLLLITRFHPRNNAITTE